jgi:hypothetical protein
MGRGVISNLRCMPAGRPTKRTRSRGVECVVTVQMGVGRKVRTLYFLVVWRIVRRPLEVGRQFAMFLVIGGPTLALRFFDGVWW